MTTWRIACRATKATNAHSAYVILTAFPLQQWLQERVSVWSRTYIACLTSVAPGGTILTTRS